MKTLPLKGRFSNPESFEKKAYSLLPFDFERLSAQKVLVTNLAGEYALLDDRDLRSLVEGTLEASSKAFKDLEARQILYTGNGILEANLLALKKGTKDKPLSAFTGLHIFVPTLRCDHSCQYCQVSRRNANEGEYDMADEHVEKALAWVFKSPNPCIKIEFQGGESLLNFPLIKRVVEKAEAINLIEKRDLQFVITTTLAFLTDEVLDFAKDHPIFFSTSLDGPEDLHNANRPRPERDSYQRATAGIRRVRDALGIDRVAALMTTTERSLGRVREIIDSYVENGLNGIFLRSLSPYGFAVKTKHFQKLHMEEWLNFYREGLEYIFELNKQGIRFREFFASLIVRKMVTPYGTSFVDLQSPSGSAISAIVFNYDGKIYGSDEGRMLAEMGNDAICLGHLDTHTYEDVFAGDKLISLLDESMQEGSPICDQCAYRHWCGTDPAYHMATQRDPVGHKAFSGYCQKHKGVFRILLDYLEGDNQQIKDMLNDWAWN
ncbi:MAG: His-Xaa-Ser system radical SAM maturase HxsB [Proteobacteria bacterium]|nr:His-Xaa-Ser system radical SAM maturase HxsB [Pseudomonadota bacterium]